MRTRDDCIVILVRTPKRVVRRPSQRVLLPSIPHDEVEADQLASSHLVGPYHRATVGTAPLCGVRRSVHSVKPWRLEDVLGKPLGRRG